VLSVEDVDDIARAALYPPRGNRSVGVARAQGYGTKFTESLKKQDYALVVQIETAAGVRSSEEIASHEAVDAVIIGPYDLSGSFGIPGEIDSRQVVDGIATVQKACATAGQPCGIFAATVKKAASYAADGFQLIAIGMDCSLLADGFKSVLWLHSTESQNATGIAGERGHPAI
jgi:2-keto-3-deoxy-L-rhamnonate aldolase RhmA